MPIGIIGNVIAVVLGGIIGSLLKGKFDENVANKSQVLFGISAISIGIKSINNMKIIYIVILSILLGGLLGELLNLDGNIKKIVKKPLLFISNTKEENILNTIVLLITIFCFSGTGIFGVITEGVSHDASILLGKSILDFFTAILFGASIGISVSFIAIPQIVVFFALYLFANNVQVVFDSTTLGNFIATGGIITLILGLNLAKIIEYKAINTVPALFIVVILTKLFS